MRRIPIVATLIVLVAVAVMIRLGFWQLDRGHQKEALLARYAAASGLSATVPFPGKGDDGAQVLYRRARIACASVAQVTTRAGTSAKGEAGVAHYATCRQGDGTPAEVVLGWSRDPAPRAWAGGEVAGTIAPGPRLVADPPLAGLEANARPDPRDLPNNHLSYAVQWFLFAAVALVIYGIALWKRLAGGAKQR